MTEVQGRLTITELLRVLWSVLGGPTLTVEELMSAVVACCVDKKDRLADDFIFTVDDLIFCRAVGPEKCWTYPTIVVEHKMNMLRLKFCRELDSRHEDGKVWLFKLSTCKELEQKVRDVVAEAQRPDYDELPFHVCLPFDELLALARPEEEL